MRLLRRIAVMMVILIIMGLIWGFYQFGSVLETGEKALPESSDVIIVLGAAVWPQGPSPALQYRLVHAAQLYREGYAKHIILSGGLGTHPPTEAEAMKNALLEMDVPMNAMYLEPLSTNTMENLIFSREIMQKNGWQTAVIVTDVFHIKRALLIARDLEIEATGAPVKNSILYRNRQMLYRHTLREVLALLHFYISKISF